MKNKYIVEHKVWFWIVVGNCKTLKLARIKIKKEQKFDIKNCGKSHKYRIVKIIE